MDEAELPESLGLLELSSHQRYLFRLALYDLRAEILYLGVVRT